MKPEFELAMRLVRPRLLFGSTLYLDGRVPKFEVFYSQREEGVIWREEFRHNGYDWVSELKSRYKSPSRAV